MNLQQSVCRPADNPFASHRVERLAFRRDGVVIADLAHQLDELGGRAAVVGPEGSGKTTLLEELANLLPGEPVLVTIPGSCQHPWTVARDQLPRLTESYHAILLDGGEQLGPVAWRRFLLATRRARSLVATLHRPGRLPTLVECCTDHQLLENLVTELSPAGSNASELEDLFDRHHGNIRLCFRELYDVYAGRP
jgi:energy-coupling factor transporter ATP-binding protein EcfA2